MEAQHRRFLEFIGSKNSWIIPVYQRSYAWDKKDCERLFDDIANIHYNQLNTYFMGATVVVSENNANELLLIDGQQRITSISLLLLAIRNILIKRKDLSTNEHLAEQIWESYLVNKWASGKSTFLRLKQVNQDSTAYQNLLYPKDSAGYDPDPNLNKKPIYKNYKVFEKKLNEFCKNNTIDDLWECFQKIQIVEILLKTEQGDKPQSVFETINHTGKKLEPADLIRNYILMQESKEIQEKWFNEFWQKIEENTIIKDKPQTTKAIWNYLVCCYTMENINEDKTYSIFVQYMNDFKEISEKEEQLAKLKRFTGYYKWFEYTCPNRKFEKYFKFFREVNQSTQNPYFMSLMEKYHNQELSEQTVCDALQFIQNYYIRRHMINAPTNQYTKTYPALIKYLQNTSETEYMEKMYEYFTNLVEYQKYVTDSEITTAFKELPLYDIKKKILKKVFEIMCNKKSREPIEMEQSTIEHIMPQTLNEQWKNEIGNDWKIIHEKYLHTIGNLTLTGYNSNLGNKPFSEKKEILQENSNISWNRNICAYDQWNERSIIANTENMTNLFISIFPDISNREKYKKDISSFSRLDDF